MSDGLEAGTVFVNTYNKTDVAAPFGGFKQSGFGKDLGKGSLASYSGCDRASSLFVFPACYALAQSLTIEKSI